MAVSTAAGTKLYIGTSETTPSPDDWLEVGEITNLGEFGRVYNEIKYTALGTRATQKFKGSYDEGSLSLDLGRAPSDVGQAAVVVALASDNSYNFKVTLNDAVTTTPTTFIFKARVLSYTTNAGSVDSVVMAKCQLSLVSGTLVETAAS
jgi:hypothetical protein